MSKQHTRSGSSSGDHQSTELAEVLKQMAAMMQKIDQQSEKMDQQSEKLENKIAQTSETLKQDLENKMAQTSEENKLQMAQNSETLKQDLAQTSEENRINNEKLGEKIEEKIAQNSETLSEENRINSEKLSNELKVVSQNINHLENKLEEQKIELKQEMITELAKLEEKLAQHTEEQRQFVNDVIGGWESRIEEVTQSLEDKVDDKCTYLEDKLVTKVEKVCKSQDDKIQKWSQRTEENHICQEQLKEEVRGIEIITHQQGEKLGLVENKTVEIQGNLRITRQELDDIISQLTKRDDNIKTAIKTEINQLRRNQHLSNSLPDTYTPNNWVKPQLWPKFRGNGDKIHPLTFLKTILHYTQDIVDDQVRLNIIRTVFQDRAMEWAEMKLDKCETIEEFKQAFTKQYWGSGQQDRLKIQLMTGRYTEGTSTRENYAIDLFNKCKYLEAFNEAEISKYLLNHFLLVDQHAIIGQDVHNIDQLIEFLRKLDDLDLAKRRNRVPVSYRPQYTNNTYNHTNTNAPYNNNNHNNTQHSHNYNTNNQPHYTSRPHNYYQNNNNNQSNPNRNFSHNTSYNNNGNRQNQNYANNHPRNPGYTNQSNRNENYRPNDRKGPTINNTYIKRGKPTSRPNYFSWKPNNRRQTPQEDKEEIEEVEQGNREDQKKKTPILKWRERSPSPTPTTSTQH